MMFADEGIDEDAESLSGAGQDELLERGIPVEFEAGGERGDPDLAHRRVGRDDEPGGGILKENIQHSALLLDLETCLLVFLAREEMPLEVFERRFRRATELLLVLHGDSVARRFLRAAQQKRRFCPAGLARFPVA